MKAIPQISEAELEVMKVLWELGEATSSQIIERLTETTDWKPKTIQTLITRLVSKDAVESDKTKGKAFVYNPSVSEKIYRSQVNESFIKKMYNGSVNLMLSSFLKEQKLSKNDIEDLKKLLEDEVK